MHVYIAVILEDRLVKAKPQGKGGLSLEASPRGGGALGTGDRGHSLYWSVGILRNKMQVTVELYSYLWQGFSLQGDAWGRIMSPRWE